MLPSSDPSATNLPWWSRAGSGWAAPAYRREELGVGIVHVGVGGFHRAHQAMYLDRLMNAGEALDWAICGVGVLEADRRMRDALRAQGCRYALVEKRPDGGRATRVIGSIAEYRFAPEEPEAVVERMADATTRIVSLTVTEGGYAVDDASGAFDPDDDVARDLEPGAAPRTVFGLVTEALARRRARGLAPFTVMSCDNLQGNGRVARTAFTAFARLRDPQLGEWVAREVRFPSSMVDRITPVTTDEDRAELRERLGIDDRWPVVCEPFAQWVLEDAFSCGRPPLERAGVQLVADVEPYEAMKLRLLNAGHQALGYLGILCGHRLVHEAAGDPQLARFVRDYMDREAQPTLAPVPGIDLEQYKRTLLDRFANREISDTLARLCADGSDRIAKFVLPVIRDRLAHDGDVACCAAIVAGWARYLERADEHGTPIVDRRRERLAALVQRQREDPLALIADRRLFGDLLEHGRFADAYASALRSLRELGARATLRVLTG